MEPKSVNDLVNEAKQQITNLTPDEVSAEIANGNVTIIDIREREERETGIIPGSVHAPRGKIEFLADPTHPAHHPAFDKNKRLILHCAGGGRSAMATVTLQQMGYTNIAHLDGGMNAWKEAGKPVSDLL